MADKWPVTKRSDIPFGDIPHVTKKDKESFDDPMNPLNKPVKEHTGKFPPNGWQTVIGDVFPTSDEEN